MVLMAMNLATVALVVFSASRPRTVQAPSPSRAHPDAGPRPVVPLDGTLVHLQIGDADAAERHAAVQLEVELEEDRDVALIREWMPRLREVVVAYFSDRTAAEAKAPGAIERTKVELRERFNRRLPVPHIRAVYVSQYIVQ
jgi:flagellar basal body-associated protein FliL